MQSVNAKLAGRHSHAADSNSQEKMQLEDLLHVARLGGGVRAGAGQETGQKQTPDKRFIHEAEIKGVKKMEKYFLNIHFKFPFLFYLLQNHILKNRSEYN